MTETKFKINDVNDQEKKLIDNLHPNMLEPNPKQIPTINDPDFDFQEAFCTDLDKIGLIADLILTKIDVGELDSHCSTWYGAHEILRDSRKNLRTICYKMLKLIEEEDGR